MSLVVRFFLEIFSQNLDSGKEICMALSKQEKAFAHFQNTVLHNDALDEKSTIMIHLAAAMAVGCYP